MAKKKDASAKQSGWQNRIVETGVKPARDFLANAHNWRIHPKTQRDALTGILNDVGWVTGVIENVTTGNLIDGHARVEEALKLGDETPVPFIRVAISEEDEKKILATLDPLSAMAGVDRDQLTALLHEVTSGDAAVMALLTSLAEKNGIIPQDESPTNEAPDDFQSYDENIETQHSCPQCGYKWSGKPA